MLVDRDNLDDVIRALGPSVDLPTGGALGFAELDDFHPDALLDRVPHLGAILDGRDPGLPEVSPEPAAEPPAPAPPGGGGGVDLLGQILDRDAGLATGAPPPVSDRPLDSVRAFAAEAARHDTVPTPDADDVARALDARTRAANALRDFLRRPDFRALERRWRSVDWMTRNLDTGPGLHLYLVDVSRASLEAEVHSSGGLEASAFGALLREGAPDGHPWSTAVMLDGPFGPGDEDQLLLAWMTALSAAFGATLVVDGDPTLAGIPSLDALTDSSAWGPVPGSWAAFRAQPEAAALLVALPGFLLRYPYGAEGESLDGLRFEEIVGTPGRQDGLWGGGSVAAAIVITREEAREDPSRPADTRLTGLPLFPWKDGVGSGMLCGQAAMTDGAARRLGEAGLIPVAWARGDDAVRLLAPRNVAGRSLL
jgi:type VI secretion system protein ImpC